MPISEKRLADIVAIADEDIDTSEIPEADEAWFKEAKLVIPPRNAPEPIDDPDACPPPGPRSLRCRNEARCAESMPCNYKASARGTHSLSATTPLDHGYAGVATSSALRRQIRGDIPKPEPMQRRDHARPRNACGADRTGPGRRLTSLGQGLRVPAATKERNWGRQKDWTRPRS